MHLYSRTDADQNLLPADDEYLFGWDDTPGIVSVWANREGKAIIWRREGRQILRTIERFYPWILASSLDDLSHLGAALQLFGVSNGEKALVRYRELDGPANFYRFLLCARDGRTLERTLLDGASHRLGHRINSINGLENEYYRVGPVEQYLMLSGRTYFRGLTYDDLHRLQFDLETTALDPHRGRIFMVAIRDNRGLATTLDAPSPGDEAQLITDLCTLIREHDPDVIENHNLFGFDLPFLEQRALVLCTNNNVRY